MRRSGVYLLHKIDKILHIMIYYLLGALNKQCI